METWFTPVEVEVETLDPVLENWANPCVDPVRPEGFGFAYFHSGKMDANLEETPEGWEKDIVLADGTDSTKYTATVIDPAFDTPVADWSVKFTTNFGSFDTSGTKAIETTTGADGKASATFRGTAAGSAVLFAMDRQGTVDMERVTLTDWRTVATVIDSNVGAGDRVFAKVRLAWENFRTGEKLMWDAKGGRHHSDYDQSEVTEADWGYSNFSANDAKIYGTFVNDEGVVEPTLTNWAELESKNATDTNADGKLDAVDIMVPAQDDECHWVQLESAGKRYALVGGGVFGRVWVGNVFYNEKTITAAYARPEVDFVKPDTLKLNAEGTQFSNGLSVTGSAFTPGAGAPDFVDAIDIYLGDITTREVKKLTSSSYRDHYRHIGKAYVGRDGTLLPVVAGSDYLKQMSPGLYDITVDGLVFKNGLEIKNMFGMASMIVGDAKRDTAGVYYLDPYLSISVPNEKYKVNVNAFGAENIEVWAGNTKLSAPSGTAFQHTGLFMLPAERLVAGYNFLTAKASWSNGYTTVVNIKVFRMSKPRFSYPQLKASGRTLTVKGVVKDAPESNGQLISRVRVGIQRLVKGKWSTYMYRTVSANSAGAFSGSFKVKAAGKYRAFVFHGDLSHVSTTRYGTSLNVK